MTHQTKTRFEKRFVAFVDIVGFEDIVGRMAADSDLFATFRDALKGLNRQTKEFKEYRIETRGKREATLRKGFAPLLPYSDLQMTAFSDCYVLSEVLPAWHVLAAVQALGSRFLAKGILTRGGVVRGGAYHWGQVVFGPAIVDAYKLERDVAKYPRILVAEPVREKVWRYHKGLWEGRLLERDVDGCWFVNLLVPSLSSWSPLSSPGNLTDVRSHLQEVRRGLHRAYQRARGNAGHMSKVCWLIHKFNRAAVKEGVDTVKCTAV